MYINGVVVLILVIYILYGRSKRNPSRLKLRETHKSDKLDLKADPTTHRSGDYANAPEYEHRHERVLNVIFQFNGHDFDAYEVLGVAAGSPLEVVDNAYAEQLKTSPEDAREFLQMAYNAIRRKFN